MPACKPHTVITQENRDQFPLDPALALFLKAPSELEGFRPADFWQSMEFGRPLPTERKFFQDSEMQTVASNFNAFCMETGEETPRDYNSLPSNPSIPPIIHFIWLGSPLTDKIKGIISTWLYCHPGWEIWIWGDSDAAQFPWSNGYSKLAFNAARSWAEKSDIWRYEILYQNGGIYTDIDSVCLKSFNDLISHDVVLFAGQETNQFGSKEDTTLYIANGLVGTEQGSPAMKFCIDNIRMEDEAPGEVLMYRTGPVLFTKACRQSLKNPGHGKVLILPCSYFYPLPYFLNLAHKQMRLQEIASLYISPESMAVHLWEESWKKTQAP